MHYLTLTLGSMLTVTRNVVKYPLHHVTYLDTQFKVARSNDLGGDTFTRNVTDERTHRRTTDRLWYEINIPFFLTEKSGYNNTRVVRYALYIVQQHDYCVLDFSDIGALRIELKFLLWRNRCARIYKSVHKSSHKTRSFGKADLMSLFAGGERNITLTRSLLRYNKK